MSRASRWILVWGWAFLGCLGCRNSIQLPRDPSAPALLMFAPADASIVAWVPDLAAAVQDASAYAGRLLAGTGWAINREKHASWRQSFGFSPLDPNAYREGGIDMAAGALVVVQAAQDKPVLALKVADANRFDAFMRASQTLEGAPPKREEQALEGHRVVSWLPQAPEAPPTHCIFYEDYVFADTDLTKLLQYVRRLPQLPALPRDSGAMAAQQRVPAGRLMIWSHRADDPPQGPMRWSISSTRADATGLASDTFEPEPGGAPAASPNAPSLPSLPTLLERIDPLSFAAIVVGAGAAAQPWGGMEKLLQREPERFGAVEEAFGESTGLSLTREVLPQVGEVMTAGIRWLNIKPPAGGWGGANLLSLMSRIEAGATLQLKDSAAVKKLLERARVRLQEQGARVQLSEQTVSDERLTIYSMHLGSGSSLGAGVSMRCVVWRDMLVLGLGSQGLARVLDYLSGKPANWQASITPQFVSRHLEGRNSMALIRFGIIGQALADFVRDTPSAPALGLLVGDLATVLLRLDDLSTSARTVDGGSLGNIDQRFAIDDSVAL